MDFPGTPSVDLSTILSRLTLLETVEVADLKGPFTVQDGGANPLLSLDTASIKAGTTAAVSDMGGCGSGASGTASQGPGLALWTGTEWRRLSRGLEKTIAPATTINLDYWKDPWRVKLSGTTVVSATFVLVNSKAGHLVAAYKPGLLSALLAAFNIKMQGDSGSGLAILGPSLALFEYDGSSIQQVQTT